MAVQRAACNTHIDTPAYAHRHTHTHAHTHTHTHTHTYSHAYTHTITRTHTHTHARARTVAFPALLSTFVQGLPSAAAAVFSFGTGSGAAATVGRRLQHTRSRATRRRCNGAKLGAQAQCQHRRATRTGKRAHAHTRRRTALDRKALGPLAQNSVALHSRCCSATRACVRVCVTTRSGLHSAKPRSRATLECARSVNHDLRVRACVEHVPCE